MGEHRGLSVWRSDPESLFINCFLLIFNVLQKYCIGVVEKKEIEKIQNKPYSDDPSRLPLTVHRHVNFHPSSWSKDYLDSYLL